jgi:ABC-2 type transport system permease protein
MSFNGQSQQKTLAAAIQGSLKSAFESVPASSDASVHRSESTGTPLVFAIADVDWLFDPFSLQKTTLGQDTVVRPLNDNLALMLNMLEFATGDEQLLAIRSRGQLHRPFSRVADLFQAAQVKSQEREATLAQKVGELEQQIAAATQGVPNVSYEELPETVTAKLKEFEGALLASRRELRAVRHSIRAEVDRLGKRLTLLNLLAGPVQVGLLAIGVFFYRRRQTARLSGADHVVSSG